MEDKEIQCLDIQTELPEAREKYGAKHTTVRLPIGTRAWLIRENVALSTLVRYGPQWHTRLTELVDELRDLKEGLKKKDALIMRLTAENADLVRFKMETLARWKLTRKDQ